MLKALLKEKDIPAPLKHDSSGKPFKDHWERKGKSSLPSLYLKKFLPYHFFPY